MAKYKITAPDGNAYMVTGPEGASDADILAHVQSQIGSGSQGATPSQSSPTTTAQAPEGGFMGKAKELYGQVENLRQYMPGMLGTRLPEMMDKAPYEAGGFVAEKSAQLGASPETAAKLGYGTNLGLQAVGTLAGGPAGESALGKPLRAGAEHVMQAALKPDKFARESGNAARAIQTILDKGYNVSKSGLEKMNAEIDRLDQELTQALERSKGVVDTQKALLPVKDALEKFRYGLDHATDQKAIRDEMLKFLNHPEVQGAMQIPVHLAQKIKVAIGQELGPKAYGANLPRESVMEGKKAVRRGLKTGVEEALAPEDVDASKINKEMGDVINARNILRSRVAGAPNRDPLSFSALTILTHPVETALWLAQRSPLVGSMAARGMASPPSARVPGELVGGAASTAMGLPPTPQRKSQ